MLFEGGFSFANFLTDVLAVFLFVVWFWLLIVVFSDLFRRHDISGWGKALWIIALLVLSYLGVFAYLITQGRGMAERNNQRVQQTRDELRRVVGFSAADEITKLEQLKKSGAITADEYGRLRTRLVE
jgi:predicted membrane channel-forming protein YqfA (hemolysin III family)